MSKIILCTLLTLLPNSTVEAGTASPLSPDSRQCIAFLYPPRASDSFEILPEAKEAFNDLLKMRTLSDEKRATILGLIDSAGPEPIILDIQLEKDLPQSNTAKYAEIHAKSSIPLHSTFNDGAIVYYRGNFFEEGWARRQDPPTLFNRQPVITNKKVRGQSRFSWSEKEKKFLITQDVVEAIVKSLPEVVTIFRATTTRELKYYELLRALKTDRAVDSEFLHHFLYDHKIKILELTDYKLNIPFWVPGLPKTGLDYINDLTSTAAKKAALADMIIKLMGAEDRLSFFTPSREAAEMFSKNLKEEDRHIMEFVIEPRKLVPDYAGFESSAYHWLQNANAPRAYMELGFTRAKTSDLVLSFQGETKN